MTEPEMCMGPQKPHPGLRQQNAFKHLTQKRVRSGGLLEFAHFFKWGYEREEKNNARRQFYMSDNSWPVPRQEEYRLIWACAI